MCPKAYPYIELFLQNQTVAWSLDLCLIKEIFYLHEPEREEVKVN